MFSRNSNRISETCVTTKYDFVRETRDFHECSVSGLDVQTPFSSFEIAISEKPRKSQRTNWLWWIRPLSTLILLRPEVQFKQCNPMPCQKMVTRRMRRQEKRTCRMNVPFSWRIRGSRAKNFAALKWCKNTESFFVLTRKNRCAI